MVSGTATRARRHFVVASRCKIERLRGVVSKEDYRRRERGKKAALEEVGALGGAAAAGMESSEEDENTPGEVMGNKTTEVAASGSGVQARQSTIVDCGAVLTKHEETQRKIDDWMTAHCILFHMMRSEEWETMVEALKNAHPSFQYARFEKALTTRVESKRAQVAARMEELRRQWPITGCMLQLDGWTDRRARPHINVMVSFPRGAVFWKSVCMSNCDKGAAAYHSILRSAIEEIGEDAVVGVIMDNAAVCAAAGRMIPWVEHAVQRALDLAKFLVNHGRVHDLLHDESNGKVVARPGATRFATNFITVDSLQPLYLPLKSCVTKPAWKSGIELPGQRHLLKAATDSILDDSFWAGIEKVQETSKELLALLKLVDRPGPTISKVYGRLDVAVEKLRASEFFTDTENDELEEIVMRRWNTMNSPLHCAAMFLDSEYKTTQPEKDAEVLDGLWSWVYSWCKPSMYVEVDAEVNCWIEGTGRFNCEEARTAARSSQPTRWWKKWCSDMPHLQKQAVRLLGQSSSSSACERNWGLFERIHSKARNGLSVKKLSTLDRVLTEEELAADAKERVDKWLNRLRAANEAAEANDDEDDNNDEDNDEPVVENAFAVDYDPQEAPVDLLRHEAELNNAWRKTTRPSKYLARQHLRKMQQTVKTMTAEHAEQYRAARAKAIEPATKTAKRGRERARKAPVQQVDDAAAQRATNGELEEGGGSGSNAEATAPKRAKRGQGRPRKSLKDMEEEEAAAQMASGRRDGGSGTRDASEEDGSDSPADRECGILRQNKGRTPPTKEHAFSIASVATKWTYSVRMRRVPAVRNGGTILYTHGCRNHLVVVIVTKMMASTPKCNSVCGCAKEKVTQCLYIVLLHYGARGMIFDIKEVADSLMWQENSIIE
ncbi:hypothetical protein CBR_g40807 [Chara braunii]|uniref:DUF659 domain-containing protein n=1 Tax=Chara braunii TaxID=69332 RepID=A0A388LUK2_CHABU|nr:hypothetical protein CBR_g40807 [Chara braunii]|eukprot:GBG85994.1 hypothetical protein CBR_g40807 [Chara braunii]